MATDPYIEVDSFIDVPIYTCSCVSIQTLNK